MFQDFRANLYTCRGRVIPPAAEDFLSVSLPADYALDGAVGQSTQVLSAVSDKSATATVTCGSMSLGHALIAACYQEQEALRASGASPVGDHTFRLANGDTITGRGVISIPSTLDGGTTSGTRAWTVMLQSRTVIPAAGLAAALAASGTV
jgi:hypothetical protein